MSVLQNTAQSPLWELLVCEARRSDAVRHCPALAVTLVQLLLSPASDAWLATRSTVATASVSASEAQQPTALDDELQFLILSSTSREEAMAKLTANSAMGVAGALHAAIQYVLQGDAPPSMGADALVRVDASTVLTQLLPPPHGQARLLSDAWADAAFRSTKQRLVGICNALLEGCRPEALASFGPRGAAVVRLLQHAGLLKTSDTKLTGEGLRFCMSEAAEQYARLIIGVARDVSHAAGGASLDVVVQHLSVLLQLDAGRWAMPFPAKDANPTLFTILARLVDVGLVYPIAHNTHRFFVVSPCFRLGCIRRLHTPHMRRLLADNLVSNTPGQGNNKGKRLSTRPEDEDTIITETNFRLYAYTRNRTLLSVLEQFTEHDTTVEGCLVCCKITRDAFVAAVRRGITAQQVLDFLALKAHPVMHRRAAAMRLPDVVPQSIGDQLRMWEADCRRVVVEDDLVLLSGLSAQQHARLLRALEERGYSGPGMVAYDADDGNLVVRGIAYDDVVHPLMTGAA